jgi:hypothetical protein
MWWQLGEDFMRVATSRNWANNLIIAIYCLPLSTHLYDRW